MNEELRNELEALVELGQTGVHTVKRSQAFKDTGWNPTEACLDRELVDGYLGCIEPGKGGQLDYCLTCLNYCAGGEKLVREPPEMELELLKKHLEDDAENEALLLYSIEFLRSSDGRECGLFTRFYPGVWNSRGDADSCRWIVFPSLEDLDLFLLGEHKVRITYGDRDISDLLSKWNRDNREFWDNVYQFHETPKDCDKSGCVYGGWGSPAV